MPRSVSVSTSPSTTIRPRRGRKRPAIALTSVVLPAPERPNSAVRPAPLSNAASSTKSPKRCVTATLSTSEPQGTAGGALDQHLRDEQREERDRDRDGGQPQRREIAARYLDQRVDRGRQGLGLAGDVRDEGDRRAELAERASEGQDHAGEDARQDQRQGDCRKYPEGVGAERRGGVFQAAVDRIERQADRAHHQRKSHHRAGQRGTGPAEGKHDPEAFGEQSTERPLPAEQQEEEVSGDDR